MSDHNDLDKHEDPARNSRNGLILFTVYCMFYGAFIYLNAFKPGVMASTPLGGVNLAILFGMGLIGAALLLALVYMFLCRTNSEGTR